MAMTATPNKKNIRTIIAPVVTANAMMMVVAPGMVLLVHSHGAIVEGDEVTAVVEQLAKSCSYGRHTTPGSNVESEEFILEY